MPLISGIATSVRTASNDWLFSILTASAPSRASVTSKPAPLKIRRIARSTAGSSSATRIRAAAPSGISGGS